MPVAMIHDISDLTVRPMSRDPSDLALLKKCFDENGSKKRLDVLRWRYLDNPTNSLLVDFAVSSASDEPHLAATYAVSPVRLKIGDQTKLAAQSIDTMTDHRHRGKGLFSSLAKSVYSRCEAEEVAAVFGFPNGSSAHGFFKRLEWTALDPVPFLIRPLGTRGVLSRLSAPLKALPNLQLVGSRPMPRRHRQCEGLDRGLRRGGAEVRRHPLHRRRRGAAPQPSLRHRAGCPGAGLPEDPAGLLPLPPRRSLNGGIRTRTLQEEASSEPNSCVRGLDSRGNAPIISTHYW